MSDYWSDALEEFVKNSTADKVLQEIDSVIQNVHGDVTIYSSEKVTKEMFGNDQKLYINVVYSDKKDETSVDWIVELLHHYFIPWFGKTEPEDDEAFCYRVDIEDVSKDSTENPSWYPWRMQLANKIVYERGIWYI